MLATDVLVLNVAATWFMVGLIWFVQIVHYPQFDGVGVEQFIAYHRRHTAQTTWVVAAPMLLELASAVALTWLRPAFVAGWIVWVGVGLVAILWASTALLQVPRHDILARGFEARAHRFLCTTNWIRTVGWTARGVLMLYALRAAVTH